jgi:hypothetical protein
MAEETRRKGFQDIRDPRTGRLLCRFDAKGDKLQFKPSGDHPLYVDLKPLREKDGEQD